MSVHKFAVVATFLFTSISFLVMLISCRFIATVANDLQVSCCTKWDMIIIEKHPCCWLLHTKDNGRNASRYYFKLQGIIPGR
jgi:hypothetical protein